VLKYRIMTACALIPLVIAGVYLASSKIFCILSAGIFLIAAWECADVVGLKQDLTMHLGYMITVTLGMVLLKPYPYEVLTCAVSLWLVAIVYLGYYSYRPHVLPQSGRAVMAWCLLLPCWLSLLTLQVHPHLLMYLFILVWGVDSVAYFVGKRFGKRRLAPLISPGKTVAGVVGAFIATLLFASTASIWLAPQHYLAWLALSLLTTLFAITGDLFESLLKRQQGVKDSGHLLPGHGGLLDRIDSLLAAAPLFTLGIHCLDIAPR
jgi:phosphatidate cytidylyltransferase